MSKHRPKPFAAPEPIPFEEFTPYVERLTRAFEKWVNDEVLAYIEGKK